MRPSTSRPSVGNFPADLPVLLSVAQSDGDEDGWRTLHERQAASVENGRVVTLRGDQYLHRTRSPEIAADTDAFLAASPR